MARTMSDERLAAIRFVLGREPEHVQKNAKALLAELDAERAAHAKTAKMLDALVSELVDAFGWTDTAPLHAVMHAKNAVLNLKADVAAERAAHEATKAEQVRVMQRMGNRTGGSLAFGRIRVLEEELAALKARLALAEAVCESCSEDWDDEFGGFDVYDHDALAAWRAAK